MAQDPEQQPNIDDTPDPQFPYGATPQEAPAPLSYISPEFYATQPSALVQQPEAQSGYTVPTPDAYQASAPYAPTPHPSYTAPQMGYGAGSNYGHGGTSQGYDYRNNVPPPIFAQPQATPLPLGEAIRQLPTQYWRVITRPSSATFAAEVGKARWNIVWVQIAFYIVVITVISVLSSLLTPSRTGAVPTTGTTLSPNNAAVVQRFLSLVNVITTYGQVLLIPLSLFVGTGLLFMLAKAFGGQGRFLPQLYSTLLFIVPLGLIVNVVTLVLTPLSGIGPLISFLAIFGYLGYESTLLGLMLMPVHRLSGGRAAGAVLSLFGVAILLACVLGFILAILLTAATLPPQ